MKHTLFLILFLTLCQFSYAQVENPIVAYEISLSLNRVTPLENADYLSSRLGGGIGIYNTFTPSRTWYPVIGIEYNVLNQKLASLYRGRDLSGNDVTFSTHTISIPIGIRYEPGAKRQFIFEAGLFGEMITRNRNVGTYHSVNRLAPGNPVIETFSQENVDYKLRDVAGGYLKIGVRIPIAKHDILVQTAYKAGFFQFYSYRESLFMNNIRLSLGWKI